MPNEQDDLQRRALTIIRDNTQPQQTRDAVLYAITHDWKPDEIVRRAEAGEDLSWAKTEATESDAAQWREQRYGAGWQRLTDNDVRRVVSTVINGDCHAADLMLLLCDELERCAGTDAPGIDVSSITITMREAAMPYTVDFSDQAQSIADRLRAEFVGAHVDTTAAATV